MELTVTTLLQALSALLRLRVVKLNILGRAVMGLKAWGSSPFFLTTGVGETRPLNFLALKHYMKSFKHFYDYVILDGLKGPLVGSTATFLGWAHKEIPDNVAQFLLKRKANAYIKELFDL